MELTGMQCFHRIQLHTVSHLYHCHVYLLRKGYF